MKKTIILSLLLALAGCKESTDSINNDVTQNDNIHSDNNNSIILLAEPNAKISTQDTTWTTHFFSNALCMQNSIPPLDFSITAPSIYNIEYFPSNGGALRLRELANDTLCCEITIGIVHFSQPFTKEQEGIYYEQFNNFSQFKTSEIHILPLKETFFLEKNRSCYLMSYNPKKTEFVNNTTIMTLGTIIPNNNLDKGLVIAISKPNFDQITPFNEIELKVLNSIIIENH